MGSAVIAHLARAAHVLVLLLPLAACRDRRSGDAALALVPAQSARLPASAANAARGLVPEAARSAKLAPPAAADAGTFCPRLGQAVDLGPAFPVAATADGVVMRTGASDLVAVRIGGETPKPSDAASRYWGPPPAVGGSSFAYFVSGGRLLRTTIPWPGSARAPTETLATDALDGTTVSAATAGRDVAAYIAKPEAKSGDRRARIWIDGGGPVDLSSEGSGGTSVAVRADGERVVAAWVDARSAMSPVHVRILDVPAQGKVALGPDVVVFIGPPPESSIELAVAIPREGPVVIAPLPKGTTTFGLVSIAAGWDPGVDMPASWTLYPNGIEPAPVSAGRMCGRVALLYARPRDAAPKALAVVGLARVDGATVGAETIVAEGHDIATVSLASRTDAGLAAWVADGRTWARTLACK